MRALSSPRLLAMLVILLLIAVTPLAGQENSADRKSSHKEARISAPQSGSTTATRAQPVRRPETMAQTGVRSPAFDGSRPSLGRDREIASGRATTARSRPSTPRVGRDAPHVDRSTRVRGSLDGYRNRSSVGMDDSRRRGRADRIGSRSEFRRVNDAAVRAERIERFMRSDDGPSRLELVDANASVEEWAEILEAVLRMGRDRADDSRQVRPVRDPNDDDPNCGRRDVRCGDDDRPGGDKPGKDDGKDDDADDEAPPIIVRPPTSEDLAWMAYLEWLRSYYRMQHYALRHSTVDCRYDAFGGSLRWSPIRQLWYGRSPWWTGSDPWAGHGCGIEYGPEYPWEVYAARLDAQIVDCAVVTVERHDDSAVSFHVDLPALGADTPDKLRKAIEERLSRGETVSLSVTLTPDQVKGVRVRACEDEDEP